MYFVVYTRTCLFFKKKRAQIKTQSESAIFNKEMDRKFIFCLILYIGMATNDSEQTTALVDINIQGISEDTFKQILARVTTTIANVIFNENYTM